jgi:large subunit ribosomal protein L18
MSVKLYDNKREKRRRKVRGKISGSAAKPRLSVFRSSDHTYAQIIDDQKGKTLACASDLVMKDGSKVEKALAVGKEIAAAAAQKKIKEVVFDRGGYRYHGRIKALADGARSGGLKF